MCVCVTYILQYSKSSLCGEVAMSDSVYQSLGHSRDQFGFRNIELLKDQVLGTGSYGGVCKAKCDGLVCAAKIMHPTLFDLRDPGTVSYLHKFEQECHLLSSVGHPNIVQYLGTYCDPDTHLPVLLMELCNESLSRFLERSPEPLSHTLQLSLAHDIVLALSYLHLNSLTHRDLTGNNILLIAGLRAKITDFGMSKLLRAAAPKMTPMTLCPGNSLYMSPEALEDPPTYTNKLDVFSFGVLLVQIATRQFPDPGPRFQAISIPDYPEGSVRMAVQETHRRLSHLELISGTHPLKSVAVRCLRDKERERPSAGELCETISELKEAPEYSEVEREGEGREGGSGCNDLQRQVETQRVEMASKDEQLRRARVEVREKEMEIAQLHTERGIMDAELERMRQRLQIRPADLSPPGKAPVSSNGGPVTSNGGPVTSNGGPVTSSGAGFYPLSWTVGESPSSDPDVSWTEERNAPEAMFRGSMAVQGETVFISPHNSRKIYVCKLTSTHSQCWSKLPDNTYFNPSLAIVGNVLVSVGGQGMFECTNSILSLTRRGLGGKRVFPNMPTARCDSVSVTTGNYLIVAGGYNGRRYLDTVEVMEVPSEQWVTACSLPRPFGQMSATICGDVLYLGGGYDDSGDSTKSLLSCSVFELVSSRPGTSGGDSGEEREEREIWRESSDLPLTVTSLVTLGGRVLAVGGSENSEIDSADVYSLESETRSWRLISHLVNARSQCLAAVVPGARVVVVGGWQSVSVEIGTLRPPVVPSGLSLYSGYDDLPPQLRINLSQSA